MVCLEEILWTIWNFAKEIRENYVLRKMMKSRVKLREQLRHITEPILEKNHTVRSVGTKIFVMEKMVEGASILLDSKISSGTRRSPEVIETGMRSYDRGESHGLRVDYRGGLYVASANSDRRFIALRKGDGVVHRSDLAWCECFRGEGRLRG